MRLLARASFRAKLFLSALSVALMALIVAGILLATSMQRQANLRIEETLVAEARVAAELLARSGPNRDARERERGGAPDRFAAERARHVHRARRPRRRRLS